MKRTTSICAFIKTTVAAASIGCLLSGCAHGNSKAAVYEPIQSTQWAPETQVIGASTNSPLNYQWYFTNGDPTATTFSVTASGGTNGALFYQWYKNTNDSQH
jgi:hypothetical protein